MDNVKFIPWIMKIFVAIAVSLLVTVVPGNAQDESGVANSDSVSWSPPRFDGRKAERSRMVQQHIAGSGRIQESQVIEAMRHVPRHLFVPPQVRSRAYRNRPLPIGEGQTISQPLIVGYMTDLLDLTSDDKVLEVGTGSGYQAAVLSEITPHVFTIEIIESLAKQASKRLQQLGYTTIRIRQGDGYYGWEEYAPFEAIIVTAAAGHIPPPLLDQLKPGGRMVIPIGGTYEVQTLMLVTKDTRGEVKTRQLMPVRFVPMTGAVRKKN